jgi:hypothetical protein
VSSVEGVLTFRQALQLPSSELVIMEGERKGSAVGEVR